MAENTPLGLSTNEVPFTFDELFFSRTDERGIIQAGNSVFQRISHYTWDELLRKPHNIIRHPDMPKAVFYLLWDYIKQGHPIGAYVKNRAKDGRYYWVYAIVTPVEGGFLSVRLKPSSAIFKTVEDEYKALTAQEQNARIGGKESVPILVERLAELGFKTYEHFMSVALSKEIEARNAQLGREKDRALGCFDELMTSAQGLLEHSEMIAEAYEANKYVPLNLQVQSAQLGESGATIGVISSNYNILSTEIQNNMGQFIASAQEVFKAINQGLFLVCTANMQQEVIAFFAKESPVEEISQAKEMAYLEQQQAAYRAKAMEGLKSIEAQAARFCDDCHEMRQLASGLEVTRVMGKVENSRLIDMKEGLTELIGDLEAFQARISDGLREIDQINWHIQENAHQLLKVMGNKV